MTDELHCFVKSLQENASITLEVILNFHMRLNIFFTYRPAVPCYIAGAATASVDKRRIDLNPRLHDLFVDGIQWLPSRRNCAVRVCGMSQGYYCFVH